MKFEEYTLETADAGMKKEEVKKVSAQVEKSNLLLNTKPRELVLKETYQNNNLSILQKNLGNCLQIIDDEAMKGYITKLNSLPIIIPNEKELETIQGMHFFKITELVYQEDEFSVHKLATIFHSLSNKPCTLALMVNSDGNSNNFYLGVRSLDLQYSSGTMMQMIKQGLLGLFPGSRIEAYYEEQLKADIDAMNVNSISSVTCIADFKQDKASVKNQDFIQGLEKFIYSMERKSYTAIFLADNLSHDELMKRRQEYEKIYTDVAPFANMQFNFMESNGISTSNGYSKGETQSSTYGYNNGMNANVSNGYSNTFGNSETNSVSDTYGVNQAHTDGNTKTVGFSDGTTHSVSDAHTDGKFNSIGLSGGISGGISGGANVSHGASSSDTHTVSDGTSHTDSISDSVSKTLTHGMNASRSTSVGVSNNRSKSISETYNIGVQRGENYSIGNSFNLVNSETLTDTFGNSQGITLNAKNMTLISILQKIEKHLERIDECESLGMWNFAAYFMGDSIADTETAANTYRSVMSGTQSGIERSAVNTWTDEENVRFIEQYVKHFVHPRFVYNRFSYEGNRSVIVNPTAMVSTNELAIHMGLPRHSVKGLPVIEHAIFAQEVLNRNINVDRKIKIGNVYHLGRETDTEVEIDVNSLAMHTFITGSTGAGKSNVMYHLLEEANKKKIPFLVVEPAKGEYKKVFANTKCYGTNPNIGEILQINPFAFPEQVHVLEHIDRLIEIFNVCWPMYAAMPAVLKESIEKAYVAAGWDIDLSVNLKFHNLFPTFDDVLTELNNTINNSEYSSDTKSDYIGSLSTRLRSLTNGINGRIFVGNEMDLKLLFEENVILDISRVGSMETKALIMGIIVLKLQEYRMANAKDMNTELKHITVLEEAHHLLKKTSTEQSQESANLQGKSVEMLTNTIAEIRTYGEGFVIVDQAPDLLDTAIIRNTNTKVVLRLPEGNDREITGKSMALNDKQIAELSKLPTGVAAIYQNDWQEAVLCKFPKFEVNQNVDGRKVLQEKIVSKKEKDDEILHALLKKQHSPVELDVLKKNILGLNISAKIKRDLLCNIDKKNLVYEWAVADFINKNYSFSDVFKGTQAEDWDTLEELAEIMSSNIRMEFEGFTKSEILKILYYICRVEHESYPDNKVIEEVRVNYLKKEMV